MDLIKMRGVSYDTLGFPPGRPNAKLLPIFPKQTLLQNSTLAIQVPTPILSCVISPPYTLPVREAVFSPALGDGDAGCGTTFGLMPSNRAVPPRPTSADSRKPGFERSMRYQSTGLTRASVSETWDVDCQGSFRYATCQSDPVEGRRNTYDGKSDPDKRSDTPNGRIPIRRHATS